jgi:hypothetical protein
VVRQDEIVARFRELEDRAAIEIERFDDEALRLLDGAIDPVRGQVDESRRAVLLIARIAPPPGPLNRWPRRVVGLRLLPSADHHG